MLSCTARDAAQRCTEGTVSPSTACLGCAAQRLLSHCPLLEHAVFSHQADSKQHCIVQQFGMCSMGNLQTCSEAPPCCSELGTSCSCPAKERGDFPWLSVPTVSTQLGTAIISGSVTAKVIFQSSGVQGCAQNAIHS